MLYLVLEGIELVLIIAFVKENLLCNQEQPQHSRQIEILKPITAAILGYKANSPLQMQ